MSDWFNYKIEMKSVMATAYLGFEYEVWFTDDSHDVWRVSKPVEFARAIDLLRFVHDMYSNHHNGVVLPEEFHIVGRMEPKQLTSGVTK